MASWWISSLYLVFLAINSLLNPTSVSSADSNYGIGVGIADITGPAAEVNMMGYAKPDQKTSGIHLRQFSRAFIIEDKTSGNRTVFVSIDACMGAQSVTLEVVKKLKVKFGDLYTEQNVVISGIHTHSAPAGFLQFVLFQVTSLGFVNQSYMALVDGIVESVQRAHGNIVDGDIYMNSGELLESNTNRSPTAYENNPAEERAKYEYNVDKTMVVLKLVDNAGTDLGMINWFAVHCTSMNNTNELISGDNKGYASYLTERHFNKGAAPGKGKFVAAFAQSNLGDVSPNTDGAKCIDTGKPCERNSSTCNGKVENCIASGPGVDMFDSTRIIGENQYNKAMMLYSNATMKLSGPVQFMHQFVDMTNVTVQYNATFKGKTCKPAMGFSFAAGTTDGPGAFDFSQGDTKGNAFWKLIRNFIKKPSDELVECHKPKPILLPTGEIDFPYPWQPTIVDTQLTRLGQLFIIAVPGEFTTMCGRRLRDNVHQVLVNNGLPANSTKVVIAGLSNTYSDYITTLEEYQVQRYEGASTIYGPHTCQAYINQFKTLAESMVKNVKLPPGPKPDLLLNDQVSFLSPVIFDGKPLGKNFGDVLTDVKSDYARNMTVSVTFQAGNPRNNLKTGDTFLSVEYQDASGKWIPRYTDADWSTKFSWKRTVLLLGRSEATVTWDIPANEAAGTYRINHYGNYKKRSRVYSYSGRSSNFNVS
ncbi:neutral ceramidase-like isoform X2 [Anneissia japonica]|uniref:neutral ceramidase-like isoform X2 n=1 Tax=Anneissia japonica TaxID=1529436 RepID=UPI001425A85F|nr:neutral ceramidase-like isoform X2 [Anneissia japonica]